MQYSYEMDFDNNDLIWILSVIALPIGITTIISYVLKKLHSLLKVNTPTFYICTIKPTLVTTPENEN
jgi:Na+/glutamate symporter